MKKIKLFDTIVPGIFATILFTLAMVSCKKTEDEQMVLPRNFRPGAITITAGQTSAKIDWGAALFTTGKVTYTVELSKNLTFQPVDYTKTTDSNTTTITDANIAIKQRYYARIKTNTIGATPESGWAVSDSFKITGEQIFKPVASGDILDISVILKWNARPGLTKIVLTPSVGTAINADLSPADLTALQKQIDGLTPGTLYSAEIFAGTVSKGTISFTTKPALSSGNIIDLRLITGRPSVLYDTLPLIPSGSTVILKKGQTYNIPATLSLSKAVTIMAGYDFSTDPAAIFLASNFNIVAGSTIDSIVFRDVTLYSDSYSAKYIFNISNACTIGKMKFESCKAEIFRGMVRLQTAVINMSEFSVNNCILDSLSNYGVINVDNVNCKADNISIKNSTIYKAEKIIVSRQNSTSVVCSNLTVNEAPWGANYFIDYSTSGTNNVLNGISVSNCIMGIGKSNAGDVQVRGIRANASTIITVTNTYNTSDYILNPLNPFPIPNLIAYAGSSLTLFQSPSQGNFKIIDNTFAGKNTSGDPRWRP